MQYVQKEDTTFVSIRLQCESSGGDQLSLDSDEEAGDHVAQSACSLRRNKKVDCKKFQKDKSGRSNCIVSWFDLTTNRKRREAQGLGERRLVEASILSASMKAGKGMVAKGSKPSDRDRRPVNLKDVKWKGIDIPAMALAPSSSRPKDLKGKGKAKGKKKQEADSGDESVEDDDGGDGAWDPFADLDEGADDFMGLQEVSGVGVQFEGDEKTGRRVGFYRTDGDRSAGDEKQNEAEGSRTAQKKAKKARGEAEEIEGAAPVQQDAVGKKAIQKEKNAKAKAGKASESKKQHSKQADEARVDNEAATEPLAGRHQLDESREQDGEDADGIPEGLFSAFATNQDEQTESLDLKAASFDDKNLKQWPKAALDQLHPILKRALHNLSFTEPTPVQKKTLPIALPSQSSTVPARDVVALAQTGSGKTLAYALPILQGILQAKMSAEDGDTETPPLQALVVLPTRELALQVYEVFQKVVAASVQSADDSGDDDGESANHKRWARIAPVVGGMSEERQWRLLQGRKGSKGHDAQIIVATVGRLWELCKSEDYLPRRLDTAKTLVLDEADRLMETGKFQELSSVLELLHNKERQTMLFSATLDPALQVNLTKSRAKISKMLKQSRGGTDTAMANLIDRVGFRDPLGPCMVDLTQDARLSENLKEGKIECVETEKVSMGLIGDNCESPKAHMFLKSYDRTSISTTSSCGILALSSFFSTRSIPSEGCSPCSRIWACSRSLCTETWINARASAPWTASSVH